MKFLLMIAITVFSSTLFADQKLDKFRKENLSQWNVCKDGFNKYVAFINGKIKEEKQLSTAELKKYEKVLTPYMETIYPCTLGGFFTEKEGAVLDHGALCLASFGGLYKMAKKSPECKAVINAPVFK